MPDNDGGSPDAVHSGLPAAHPETPCVNDGRSIEVDDGGGFRAATTAEVDAALRQRELFGAAEYTVRHVGSADDDRDDVDVG